MYVERRNQTKRAAVEGLLSGMDQEERERYLAILRQEENSAS
jgi:hypothetical protein